MKILVTGGAGFIGSHLVEKFLNKKCKVVVLDNLSSGRLEFMTDFFDNKNFELYQIDLLKDRLDRYFDGVDEVWHLAANAEVRKYDMKTFIEQIEMTKNVLEAMKRNGVKKIVFTSSSVVYGEAIRNGKPTPENYQFNPISLYAASKIACEALIQAWCSLNNRQAWIFRLANVVGPRLTHGVIFDFVNKLRKNPNELEILGDGNQKKSYIYVDDCIEAMIFARRKSNDQINIFNVGNEDWITVKEIAKIVSRKMGLKPELRFTGGDRGWPGDVPLMLLDISELKLLGFELRYNSREAIEKTVEWMVMG